jgi:ABC-type multidrug transport system ATPase subunit
VCLDGEKATSEQVSFSTGFVWQTDVLLPTATVKETVLTAARLKLPNSISDEEKLSRVEKIIEVLRLGKCMNQKTGGGKIPDMSGGEKRRTSIAVELVTSPRVLFMDEATSGLDSSTVRSFSKRNNTIIIIIVCIITSLFDQTFHSSGGWIDQTFEASEPSIEHDNRHVNPSTISNYASSL